MRGGRIYVTDTPCIGCQRLIDGMGLEVVCLSGISKHKLISHLIGILKGTS